MKILCVNVRKGIGDQVIFLPYMHAISKNLKNQSLYWLKKILKPKIFFYKDDFIKEIITLEKDMDGISGMFKLIKLLKEKKI